MVVNAYSPSSRMLLEQHRVASLLEKTEEGQPAQPWRDHATDWVPAQGAIAVQSTSARKIRVRVRKNTFERVLKKRKIRKIRIFGVLRKYLTKFPLGGQVKMKKIVGIVGVLRTYRTGCSEKEALPFLGAKRKGNGHRDLRQLRFWRSLAPKNGRA
jgi:hypothetical protein